MDVLDELKKIKDEKLQDEIRKAVTETLKRSDEEMFFEEETLEIASQRYIEARLIKKNNAYFTKGTNEGPFCMICWDENHQLNNLKNENEQFVCLVCKIKSEIQ